MAQEGRVGDSLALFLGGKLRIGKQEGEGGNGGSSLYKLFRGGYQVKWKIYQSVRQNFLTELSWEKKEQQEESVKRKKRGKPIYE